MDFDVTASPRLIWGRVMYDDVNRLCVSVVITCPFELYWRWRL